MVEGGHEGERNRVQRMHLLFPEQWSFVRQKQYVFAVATLLKMVMTDDDNSINDVLCHMPQILLEKLHHTIDQQKKYGCKCGSLWDQGIIII